MSGNWELFGYNFSLLMIILVSLIMGVSVWLGARKATRVEHAHHVDTFAGDEG